MTLVITVTVNPPLLPHTGEGRGWGTLTHLCFFWFISHPITEMIHRAVL